MNIFKRLVTYSLIALPLVLAPCSALAQGSGRNNTFGGIVQLDKTVHDFGDILVSDGPVTAVFTVKNVSEKAILIYNVVSSCGCTNVEWTKKPINPGGTGTIKVTFKNDEKGYPFDKTLTAYFSGLKQPVVLRLRESAMTRSSLLRNSIRSASATLPSRRWTSREGTCPRDSRKAGICLLPTLGASR